MFNGTTVNKGTSQWVANEKLINQNEVLKKARANSRGDEYRGAITSQIPSQAYLDNYDAIFGNKGRSYEENKPEDEITQHESEQAIQEEGSANREEECSWQASVDQPIAESKKE
jgi:hypothetical protein